MNLLPCVVRFPKEHFKDPSWSLDAVRFLFSPRAPVPLVTPHQEFFLLLFSFFCRPVIKALCYLSSHTPLLVSSSFVLSGWRAIAVKLPNCRHSCLVCLGMHLSFPSKHSHPMWLICRCETICLGVCLKEGDRVCLHYLEQNLPLRDFLSTIWEGLVFKTTF